jgi:CubicO group peptidase (beta-lactamase class C family)
VPGAVIGALHGHKLSWIAPLGVREAGMTEPITRDTLFHAASLTKQITTHAAFALRAQGRLDFDRPLVEYVDDLRSAEARRVTARHVLSQSSGFPNWRSAEADKPTPELVSAFAPGSRYQYSGEGFFYLQRVMEHVTDAAFEQIVTEQVFRPLGMTSSTLVWDPATLARTALPHTRSGEAAKNRDSASLALRKYAASIDKPVGQLKYAEYVAALAPDGPVLPNGLVPNAAASLVTSAEDYARFLAAAIRNPELGQQHVTINDFLGWGLGWAIERASGHTYLWQWGDNPGFKNFVLAEPSTGGAIFVFTNGDNGSRIYDRVLTHATGHDHAALLWL